MSNKHQNEYLPLPPSAREEKQEFPELKEKKLENRDLNISADDEDLDCSICSTPTKVPWVMNAAGNLAHQDEHDFKHNPPLKKGK